MADIATEYELSADHSSMLLTLREGLKWSNGDPFTADDILFRWEAINWHDEIDFWGGGAPATGTGGEAGGAAAADDAVDAVEVDEGGGAAAAVANAGGEHVDDFDVGLAGQRSERSRPTEEAEEVVQRPVLAGGLGDDLLGEHVEGGDELDDSVEFAGADGAHEGGALDQFVAGCREQAALWTKAEGVAGAADALQKDGDAAG